MIHGLLSMTLATLMGSITPHRTYYQVDRAMPVTIAEGESRELVLLTPKDEEVARVSVPDGETEIDVAALVPDLYEYVSVHYLQLEVDGEPTGPSLVLQPLIERPTPVLTYDRQGPTATPRVTKWINPPRQQLAMAGFRVYEDKDVVLRTDKGDIRIALAPEHAPNTAYNFRHLVEGGFYTMIPFHRIVPFDAAGKPFVIQAGDPTGTGMGSPGYSIDLEASKLPHDLGVISMAREGRDIDTGGSQFFICLSREGTGRLDVQYTSFGKTIDGLDVVKTIAATDVNAQGRPATPIYIRTSELVDAAPRSADSTDASEDSGESTTEADGGTSTRVDR